MKNNIIHVGITREKERNYMWLIVSGSFLIGINAQQVADQFHRRFSSELATSFFFAFIHFARNLCVND